MCFVSGGCSQCGWEFCVTCGMLKRTRLGDNRAHQLWSYCKFPKQQRAGTNDHFFHLYMIKNIKVTVKHILIKFHVTRLYLK